MALRAEGQARHAAPPGLRHQGLEQRRPDTTTAPGGQHGHAPDMAVRQQAPGAHRFTVHPGQRVTRQRIELVQLHLDGHTLFIHKNPEADRRGLR